MLRFLRKYSSSIGVKILYGLLAALFILWMGGGIGGERRLDVAVVYGEAISRGDELARLGPARAAAFSWRSAAEATASVYRELA